MSRPGEGLQEGPATVLRTKDGRPFLFASGAGMVVSRVGGVRRTKTTSIIPAKGGCRDEGHRADKGSILTVHSFLRDLDICRTSTLHINVTVTSNGAATAGVSSSSHLTLGHCLGDKGSGRQVATSGTRRRHLGHTFRLLRHITRFYSGHRLIAMGESLLSVTISTTSVDHTISSLSGHPTPKRPFSGDANVGNTKG